MLKQEIRLLLSSAKKFIDQLPPLKQHKASSNIMNILQQQKSDEQMIKDIKYQINFLKLTNPAIQFQMVDQEESLKEEKTQPIKQKEEETELKNGTYILKDGKLIQGKAEKRMEVDYSNWYAANVDPDDLKKHKELLDRQHFGGPFWDGKPKPKSILDEENPNTLMYSDERPEPEINPNLQNKKSGTFEKVKR